MSSNNSWAAKFKPCIYSTRLLNKLDGLAVKASNTLDFNEIKKALYCARKYHANQRRQSGELYYSHPIEVAYMISDYLLKTDIIVTSILHDTIEDTSLTKEAIEQMFGPLVASQVMDLTKIKENGVKISAASMIKSLFEQKKYNLLFIKLFDRLHNMQTISAKSPQQTKKIIHETLSNFITLAAYLEIRNVEYQLVQLCQGIIDNDRALTSYHLPAKDDKQVTA